MTPRTLPSPGAHQARSPTDLELKPQPSTHESPSEPEEEARPSHTAEIGTLKKLSVPGGTAWLGSSSGVYFVNTVRRAFSAAFAANASNAEDNSDPETVPASEDIITGEDAAGRNFNAGTTAPGRNAWWLHDADFHRRIVSAVGRPPADHRIAMDLVTTFFRTTHPLFPFLHGPKFLEDVNEIYTALQQSMPSSELKKPTGSASAPPRAKRTNSTTSIGSNVSSLGNIQAVDPLKLITFQIIINIAALSQGGTSTSHTSGSVPSLPATSTIHSTQALLSLILPLSTTPLLPTIQLLLAAELYLLSTISLRQASSVAGLVLRLIYHTGLHRCPLRYASLTPQDCEIRKRVFWSAYALDRHLSLALGDPNTFQDSDIDVCLSRDGDGEMHRAVARDFLTEEERENEMKMHYPRDSAGRRVLLVNADPQQRPQRYGGDSTAPGLANQNNESGAGPTSSSSTSNRGPGSALPMSTGTHNHSFATSIPPTGPAEPTPELSSRAKSLREAALTAYVNYGKLTGRIIEIFHKSINFRFPKEDAIGFLSADIENWWNDLPSTLTGGGLDDATVESNLSHRDSIDITMNMSGSNNRARASSTASPSANGPNTNTNTSNDTRTTKPSTDPPPIHDNDTDPTDDIPPALITQHRALTPFFTLLYHQLLLLLNRPRLSLDQSTAPFQQGLQTCIRASRNTLTALQQHRANAQSMFLPGLLSAAWMSGLIIAFACQLGKYPKKRACADIRCCLGLLEGMGGWYTVRNCSRVLELLLGDIMGRRAAGGGSGNLLPVSVGGVSGAGSGSGSAHGGAGMGGTGTGTGTGLRYDSISHTSVGQSLKRNRDSMSMDNTNTNSEAEPSPKRDSISGVSPASSDFRAPQFRSPDLRSHSNSLPGGQHQQQHHHHHQQQQQQHQHHPNAPLSTASFLRQESTLSNASFDFPNQPPSTSFQNMSFNNNNNNHSAGSGMSGINMGVGVDGLGGSMNPPQQRAGAALYADPQDMAFAQSSHSMGGFNDVPNSSAMDDQMFWGNMDSNLFDVFGAVSWENMTGPAGPMASNPNVWDVSAFANPNAGSGSGGGNDTNMSGTGRFM